MKIKIKLKNKYVILSLANHILYLWFKFLDFSTMISKKMKSKIKNISVISTGSWVPSNLSDKEIKNTHIKFLLKN